MTGVFGADAAATVAAEAQVPGPVPRFELRPWREAFGVVAGITGRQGEGEDFDLGLGGEQPVGRVLGRWRRFREDFPEFPGSVLGYQVHGTALAEHGPVSGWLHLPGVDGHLTSSAGVLLLVTAADCIPVYLIDVATGRLALLHAGWRGVAGGILAQGVARMVALGSTVENIVVHCGVGICGACYEVGSEVLTACGAQGSGPEGRRLDLRGVLVGQAVSLGLRSVSVSPFCSAHHADRFFSHRRSRGADGRMVAYLGRLP